LIQRLASITGGAVAPTGTGISVTGVAIGIARLSVNTRIRIRSFHVRGCTFGYVEIGNGQLVEAEFFGDFCLFHKILLLIDL
jgi:hypothetical protein